MRIDVPRGVTALACTLLLASCDTSPPSSPAAKRPVAAVTSVSAGPFTFENFELGAAPGTVCPGSTGCTNGAAEPMIRADATGTFYVSSELGLSSGTLAWKSTDGGLHYRALQSPNQISQSAGGGAPGGGDTDLSTAPQANANGIPNSHAIYQVFSGIANAAEAALPTSFHAVWIGVSRDGGQSFTDHAVYVNPNTAVSYGHQFVNVSIDRAGTVYVVYTDDHNLFYSFSTDGGQTWTGPIQINQSPSATAIMPWSVACAPGQLNVVWYGTSFFDGATAPDNYPPSATWFVFFAQNVNAAAVGSTFTQVAATPVIHLGGVCEGGISCTGNRDLFDDFGIAVSPITGLASITYSDDQPGNTGSDDHTAIATQTAGPTICTGP